MRIIIIINIILSYKFGNSGRHLLLGLLITQKLN